MGRLTDRKTVADLKANVDRLRALGIEPNISDLRYIKLAEYENRYERTNHKEKGRCVDCVYGMFHREDWMPSTLRGVHLFCKKYHTECLLEGGCSEFTNKRG